MARASRRRGPAADFTIPAALTVVPNLTVTRFYNTGLLLIIFFLEVNNNAAIVETVVCRVLVDGTPQPNFLVGLQLPIGLAQNYGYTVIVPVTQGIHTIQLQAQRLTGGPDVITANSGELSVIELPAWDLQQDIL